MLLGQRIGTPPSQLLMPVAFAGSAGGLLMLMSSPVNVIVSEAAADAGEGAFAFFSFSLVGIPLLVGTVAICLLLGRRLLPTRMPDYMPPDLGRYAEMVRATTPSASRRPSWSPARPGSPRWSCPPRSRLVGERVHAGMRREHDLVILAVQRLGRDLGDEPIEVAEGDALLLHGRWSELDALSRDRDVLLVDSPELVRRQAVPWGAKATRAVLVLAALVGMLASGQVPPAIAGLAAAVAMVLLPGRHRHPGLPRRLLADRGAGRRAHPAVHRDLEQRCGRPGGLAADRRGRHRPPVPAARGHLPAHGALGQVVSNTATVLVVVPIAVAAAEATGTSVKPVLMVVAIAGCAALLTPIATPGNMMIMTPGRLPVRRLLEARAAGHGLVVRRRDRRRPPRVGPVTTRPAIASTGIDERGTTW